MPEFMKRPVRIASICLQPESDKSDYTECMITEVKKVAQEGVDVIVTPEVWTTYIANSYNGDYSSPALDQLKDIARQHHTYIVALMRRYTTKKELEKAKTFSKTTLYQGLKTAIFNSAILIDRQGKTVFSYDKVFPVLAEMYSAPLYDATLSDTLQCMPNQRITIPGNHVGVYQCDFGKLGLAICFDMNYTELFRQMALAGAELVVWSAAYSGGRNARMQAGIYNYYVVTCTAKSPTGDCRVCDITGDELLVHEPQNDQIIYTTIVTLDLDRTVFHKDYNETRIKTAVQDYAGKLEADYSYGKEGWIILKSISPDISVAEITQKYGLTTIREYKFGIGAERLKELRGNDIYWQ